MRVLTFLCVFVSAVVNASASSGDEFKVLRKCCLKNQRLIKVADNDYVRYECLDGDSAKEKYHVLHFSQLVVADNVVQTYGTPENCEITELVSLTSSEVQLSTTLDVCYDTLVLEITNYQNTTSIQNIPHTVSLTCVQNETDNMSSSNMKINRIRKCCPDGQAYDAQFHLCRDIEIERQDKWKLSLFDAEDNYIFAVDYGLHCKNDQYSVELVDDLFRLEVVGESLKYLGKHGGGEVPHSEWCIDSEYNSQRLMARVCTQNCETYGAFCLKKCCPLGQHYKTIACGTFKSRCVPDIDDSVLFNTSHYLDPLREADNELLSVLGIRIGITCPKGKFGLNISAESDYHALNRYGELEVKTLGRMQEYCFEAFDMRDCDPSVGASGFGVVVSSLTCFIDTPPEKNFFIAAVTNSISAVCLALTLVVYCVLPELRNLHGRTIICHVSTLLLAYSCLARVQSNMVNDGLLCVFLGYGIYFGFMSAFVWLNVMCFDIWWTFGSIRSVQPLRKAGAERRRFIWYSIYAWGLAFLFTLSMFLFDKYPVADFLTPNIGNNQCWFGSAQNSVTDWPHYVFFVIPMGLITCVNLVLWLLTARHCARVRSEVHRLQAGSVGDRAKKRFRIDRAKYVLTGKLFVVMGAGWFSELLSTLTNEPLWLWTIIDLVNQLQGLFIFLILVLKPKIYHLILKRIGLEKPDAQKNGTASSARTSSTFLSRTISSDERTNLRTSLPNNVLKKA